MIILFTLCLAFASEPRNARGQTPFLELVGRQKYREAFRLLDRGADINAADDEGLNALMYLIIQDARDHQNRDWFVRLLLRHPYIGAVDRRGFTALHFTASYALEPLTLMLLNEGADPSAREWLSGQTPLMIAAWEGQLIATRHLVAALAVEDASGNVALHYAVEQGNPEVLDYLLQRRPNLNHANRDGETPLMRAAAARHPEYVRTLLARGADPALRDRQGRTYLEYGTPPELVPRLNVLSEMARLMEGVVSFRR